MIYRSGLLIPIILIILTPTLLSQQARIDSLHVLLQKQKQGNARANTLIELCNAYRSRDLRESAAYGQQAVRLAQTAASPLTVARARIALGWTEVTLRDNVRATDNLLAGLTVARRLRDTGTIIRALRGLGKAQRNMGNLDSALTYYQQALESAIAADDKPGIASTQVDIGTVHRSRARFDEALQAFEQALAYSEQRDDSAGVALALIMIGDIDRRQGRAERAEKYFERSLAIAEALDDRSLAASGLYLLASIHLSDGDYDVSLPLFHRSLGTYEALGDTAGIAIVLTYLGHIHNMQGRYADALDDYERGLKMNEQLGLRSNMIGSLISIGNIQFQQGRYERALASFQRSLRLCDEIGQQVLKASALIHIGRISMEQEKYDRALDYFTRGREVFEKLDDASGVAVAEGFIADLFAAQGNYSQALEYYRRGLRQFEDGGDKMRIAQTLNSIGVIQTRQERFEDALSSSLRSLQLHEELEEKPGITEALLNLSVVHLRQGSHDSAIIRATRAHLLAQEMGAFSQASDAARLLSDAYARKSDFTRAYEFHKLYTVYKDSVINENSVKSLNEMTVRFEAEKREQRITLLEKDRALQNLAFARQQEELVRQQLESRQKQQMLRLLGKEREITDLTLANANIEIQKQRIENARKQNDVALLMKDKQLQSAQLERETLRRNVSFGGIIVMIILLGLLLHRYRYRKRTSEQLSATLSQLQLTQSRLIHAEKMVTLGEMTAGLAHEIKNPLNFVTNFSVVTQEMLTDLEGAETPEAREAILADLRRNLTKIEDHGRRADKIIQGMMLHARGGIGELINTDINTLVEESVNLAYHGMRATHLSFDVRIIREYHPGALEIGVIPQAISRVLLNLLNNAMYAVSGGQLSPAAGAATQDAAAALRGGEEPTIWISTALRNRHAEIRVRDNGSGIPEDIQQKIFEPFFTTKPAGDGTGLGLSMSYDIIVNGHGGTLTCNSDNGGAEFVISLPANAS